MAAPSRIPLDVAGDEYAGAWAQLKERRSWDDVVVIQEAADRSLRGVPGTFTLYRQLQIQKCVEAWSLDADPRDPRSWGQLGEHVIREVIRGIEAFYGDQMDEVEARRKANGTG